MSTASAATDSDSYIRKSIFHNGIFAFNPLIVLSRLINETRSSGAPTATIFTGVNISDYKKSKKNYKRGRKPVHVLKRRSP